MTKALVVDDNELDRKLAAVYLSKAGYKIEFCSNPYSVLRKVKEFDPDVILLEVKMPSLCGIGGVRLLRYCQRGFRCKTIILSSEDEHLQQQMVEEGLADEYFVKSHSFEGLKVKLDRVFEVQENLL